MIERVIVRLTRIVNKIKILRKNISVSQTAMLLGVCDFQGCTQNISIGDNTTIRSGKYGGNYVGMGKTRFFVFPEGEIEIGNKVGISNSIFVSRAGIKIEDEVMIGGGCRLYDSDFHSLDYETRVHSGDSDIKSAPIYIKKGAFIGAGCIILKGVTIGEGSIIGAGAVVTKNVPDHEIWAGNPAGFVRKTDMRTDNIQ